ncbi:unnamed protein product, partial [Ectocarpus sp. 12 AP-2014]
FGHYLYGEFWLNLYWILFTCILAAIGKIFWNRGFFSSAKERLKLAKQRLNGKTIVYSLFFVFAFISVGAYSFYNLKVLNQLEDGDYSEKLSADSEKAYGKYIDKPHIQVIDLKANIDIYPEERKVDAQGIFKVVNPSEAPIDTLLMEIKFPISDTKITKVVYNGAEIQPFLSDSLYRLFIYKLPQPLQPKDTANLVIETKVRTHGFAMDTETAVL